MKIGQDRAVSAGCSRRAFRNAGSAIRRACVETLEERRLLAVLNIAQENALPGTPEATWDSPNGVGDLNLQGFATDFSLNAGSTVNFKIDDKTAASYHIEIYRLGWYQGNGARLVATIDTASTIEKKQAAPLVFSPTGLVDCGNWTTSASWNIPADATSGLYLAKLQYDGSSGSSHIPFIVRRDGNTSDMVMQTSDNTWQAYNNYAGNSLYQGNGATGRAYKVSYNRPFYTRGNAPEDFLFNAEYPMIRFLEHNGYDVSYISGIDTDRLGVSNLTNHKLYITCGHDEYWSGNQRANVEAARAAGTNLAFFSGNQMFWKTRWENSADGSNTPYRTLVCYKETHDDAKIDPTAAWTGTWRDPRFSPPADGGRPENAVSGQIFLVNNGTTAIKVPAADGKARLWRNTSVATQTAGATATLAAETLGYEWDTDSDNGFRPAGMIRLSSTSATGVEILLDYGSSFGTGNANHYLTLYKAPSGALVFGAGTVQWSWGLDDHHDRGSGAPDSRMQQATVNLFADMSVQPGTLISGLVAASKSTDTAGPSVVITSPAPNGNYQLGQSVNLSGTATDTGGGIVQGVEVSIDGGQTWHPATGRASWSYSFATQTGGPQTILVRAIDDSANIGTAAQLPINVLGPTGETIFGSTIPSTPLDPDATPVEVGVKFKTDVNGFINGIRFYKGGSTNGGTHVAHLWSITGTLLATATFSGESTSGWQAVAFTNPVAVTAGTIYVASYYAPQGRYAEDDNFFVGKGAGTGHVQALAAGVSGPNGVYGLGSVFPTQNYASANYYVDVFFSGNTGPDLTPPSITARSPAANATNVSTGTTVTATFSESIQTGANLVFTLTGPGGAVAANVSYNDATKTATLTPTSALAGSTTYTASISAKDIAGNIMSTQTWTFTTATPDLTPPSVTSTTPANGATGVSSATTVKAVFSESIKSDATLVFTLKNTATSATVAATVVYDDATKTATLTPTSVLATSTSYTASVTATDLAGNAMGAPVTWSFTTGATLPTQNIFGTTVPATMDSDTQSTNIGVRFRADVDGVINSIRFYKFSANTGTHVGSLWTNTGTLLGRVTFSGETASGWQTANFATPIAITANTSYVASYLAPVGRYAGDVQVFAGQGAGTGNIKALADGVDGPNGIYAYSATSAFPNIGWLSANFYVDVNFTPGGTVADTTPPTVSGQAPASGATNVALAATVSGTFNEAINAATLAFTLTGPGGAVAGTTSYNATTRVATFTPSAPLANNTTYTARLSASDTTGNAMAAPATWSFTTVVGDITAPVVSGRTPAANATNVATNTTVTATFNEAINPATLVFTLTDNLGNPVAAPAPTYNAATFTATFTPTSALAQGVTYTASVRAADTTGNLMASATTWTFTTTPPDLTAPTVSNLTPASGATNVATSTSVSATFSEAINTSTLVFTLTDNLGNPVAGPAPSYNAATRVATFTPTSALAQGVTYTASIRAADTAGNLMASATTWTFTTVPPDLTPPTVSAQTPASGATGVATTSTVSGTFSEAINQATLAFTLTGPGGAVAGSVSYNATTRVATFTPSAALANSTTYTASLRASDVAGNAMAAASTWTFTTAAPVTSLSMWTNSTTPASIDSGDARAVEVGVKFTSDVAGFITGIRFYKASANGGTHSGSLWTSGGTRLAQATFSGETASGWQTVTFSSPVAITAGTVYVASYYAPQGHYSESNSYFASAGTDNGTLHFLRNGVSGNNGIYRYANQSRFPNQSFQSTNYWVDVVFSTSGAARSASVAVTPPETSPALVLGTLKDLLS